MYRPPNITAARKIRLTFCIHIVTIDHMKLLMDADCLIKLTKAGLKELVCQHDTVVIPAIVEQEVVDDGKAKGCDDAFVVEKNIKMNFINVVGSALNYKSGDSALAGIFPKGGYDAVATDDTKLIRRLRTSGIPFIIPGLIIYHFLKDGCISKLKAIQALNQLAEFISNDEFSTVRLLMERLK